MDRIEISVIVPVYNAEAYLKECLDSIFSQEFSEFEVICVDNCSTDRSKELLQLYEADYPEMRIINNSQNRGVSYSRNVGISNAKGKYLLFVDADDMLKANAFSILFPIAEKQQTDILFFDSSIYAEDIVYRQEWDRINRYSNKKMVLKGPVFFKRMIEDKKYTTVVWGQLIKRDFLIRNQLMFINDLLHEDILFTFMELMIAKRVSTCDKKLYIYRRHSNSLSTTFRPLDAHSVFLSMTKIMQYWNDNTENLQGIHEAIRDYEKHLFRIFISCMKRCKDIDDFTLGTPADQFLYSILTSKNVQTYIELTDEQFVQLEAAKHIYIYGAGTYGIEAHELLVARDLQTEAFLVTEKVNNPDTIDGVRVIKIDDAVLENSDIVIIAASVGKVDDIIKSIQEHGHHNYMIPYPFEPPI